MHFTDGNLTRQAATALSEGVRVVLSSGKFAAAGLGDRCLGVVPNPVIAADDYTAMRPRTVGGTMPMLSAGAITAGALVYAAADGKIDDVGFVLEGRALEAAGGAGELIEVLILDHAPIDPATIAAAGSTQGDATALTKPVNTVTGADGTKGVLLPAAVAGLVVEVYNSVATHGLKVYPASGDDINDGSADAAVTIEGKSHAIFRALDAATWAAIFTVNT